MVSLFFLVKYDFCFTFVLPVDFVMLKNNFISFYKKQYY